MDETSLRRLLDSALAQEPPMGPVAASLATGRYQVRRRRRARNTMAGVAAVAAIAVAIPGGHRDTEPRPRGPGRGHQVDV